MVLINNEQDILNIDKEDFKNISFYIIEDLTVVIKSDNDNLHYMFVKENNIFLHLIDDKKNSSLYISKYYIYGNFIKLFIIDRILGDTLYGTTVKIDSNKYYINDYSMDFDDFMEEYIVRDKYKIL